MKYPTLQHPLKLKNTLSGSKQSLVPLRNRTIKLFTCGPSIYAAPHLGNYRSFLYEDILNRYLEYLGYSVERLINFTDVEDKAIEKAGKDKQKLCAITEDAAESFHRNCGLLHIRIPDFIPRSSTSVDQAVWLITTLLDRGVAYRLGPDIFYDPLKFKGFGRLYGLDMSKWPKTKRHYRRDTYRGNRWNLGDFILWHGYRRERDGDIFWETELGRGRPAWNVQDPAMITKHLGFRIDIACGGVDNLYRHHDYNIAVIEAVSDEKFASFWLHGEHVLLDGKKISKSRGNIVYPEEILSRGIRAAALRFSLISVHYREKLNLTDDFLREKENEFRRLYVLTRQFSGAPMGRGADNYAAEEHIDGLTDDFEEAMNDDLQVAPACEALRNRLEELSRLRTAKGLGRGQWDRIQERLRRLDSVLQILFE
jgi:cysteinyl-tRNA synthetase